MDPAFLQAAAPTPRKVLWFHLRHLTVGHRFLLARHNSAFITGAQAKIEDLVLSVFICCQPWKNAEKALSSWWLNSFVWLWSQTFRWLILPLEYQKFHAYWNEAHACPEFDSDGSASECGSPYELRLYTFLRDEFSMTKDEVMGTSIAEANALWASQGERTGKLELQSDRIRNLREFARQCDLEKFGSRMEACN